MSRVSVTAARKALLAEKKLASIRTGTGKDYLTYHALKKSMGLFQENAFVPWVSYVFPPEILASYGLTPLIPELAGRNAYRHQAARASGPGCQPPGTGAGPMQLPSHVPGGSARGTASPPISMFGNHAPVPGQGAPTGQSRERSRGPLSLHTGIQPPDEGPAEDTAVLAVAQQL